MKIMRGFTLWLLASIALYFCSVATLWVMTLIFRATFESTWISAIAVTILGEIVMFCSWLYSKHKRS